MALKILGRVTSINVRKARWTADAIGIEYESESWGLPDRDPHSPEFLALNPNALVPVIIDDGFVLWESNAIMRYLADRHRSGLWPAERQARALVDQWLTWQATALNPAWTYAFHALTRKSPGYTDEARIADSCRKWTEAMRILEARLKETGGFVAGGMSIADIALALSVHRWMVTPFDKADMPEAKRFYETMKATPEGTKYMGEGFV